MSSGRLRSLFGSPVEGVAEVPWNNSSAEVGIVFPSDYREFVDRYGSVRINGELSVWIPMLRSRDGGPDVGFPGFVRATTHGIAAELAADDDMPYSVFPDPGGLLGWGSNINADQFFWLTDGDDPDSWPIIAWYRSLNEWDYFDGGFSDFVAGVVDGTYRYAEEVAPANPEEPLWVSQGDWASVRPL